jgi:hypothetical protein
MLAQSDLFLDTKNIYRDFELYCKPFELISDFSDEIVRAELEIQLFLGKSRKLKEISDLKKVFRRGRAI